MSLLPGRARAARGGFGAVAAAVLAAHVLLLGSFEGVAHAGTAPRKALPETVRLLPAPVPPEPVQVDVAAVAVDEPAVFAAMPSAVEPVRVERASATPTKSVHSPTSEHRRRIAPMSKPLAATTPSNTVRAPEPEPEPERDREPTPVIATVALAEPVLMAAATEPSAAASSADAPPVYPTKIPPAFDFVYDLSRGMLHGSGALGLRITADGYEAKLEGKVAGLSVLEQKSVGGLDSAGFAPVRYTDQRLRRSAVAANFQRDAGKITYSGDANEIPLPAGAQDRVSWMVQLAAIAHARPQKLTEGAQITMFVSGARADADLWSFVVVGPESIQTPLGNVATIHLLRESRGAHDTRADVWLDPSRHHLPVRARLSNTQDGSDAFELMLKEAPARLP